MTLFGLQYLRDAARICTELSVQNHNRPLIQLAFPFSQGNGARQMNKKFQVAWLRDLKVTSLKVFHKGSSQFPKLSHLHLYKP